MTPAKQLSAVAMLLDLNPIKGTVDPAVGWERSWTIAMMLVHHIQFLEKGIGHIATTPTLDMAPVQLAVITGIK